MDKIIEWAHDEAQANLPDLELNGPVTAEDLAYFLRDRYYDTFSECTTNEVRDVLRSVAKDYCSL